MMFSTKGLLLGATMMQIALAGAAGAPARPVDPYAGAGLKESWLCAGCLAAGLFALSNGSAQAALITFAIGGPGAITVATAVAGCIAACEAAVD